MWCVETVRTRFIPFFLMRILIKISFRSTPNYLFVRNTKCSYNRQIDYAMYDCSIWKCPVPYLLYILCHETHAMPFKSLSLVSISIDVLALTLRNFIYKPWKSRSTAHGGRFALVIYRSAEKMSPYSEKIFKKYLTSCNSSNKEKILKN